MTQGKVTLRCAVCSIRASFCDGLLKGRFRESTLFIIPSEANLKSPAIMCLQRSEFGGDLRQADAADLEAGRTLKRGLPRLRSWG